MDVNDPMGKLKDAADKTEAAAMAWSEAAAAGHRLLINTVNLIAPAMLDYERRVTEAVEIAEAKTAEALQAWKNLQRD